MKKLLIITLLPFVFSSCKKDESKDSDHTLKFDITCADCTLTVTGGLNSEYRIFERVKGSKSIIANMSELMPFAGSIKSESHTQDLKILATEKKGSVSVVKTAVDEKDVEATVSIMFDNGFLNF